MNKYLLAGAMLMAFGVSAANAEEVQCNSIIKPCVENKYNAWLSEHAYDPQDYRLGYAQTKVGRNSEDFPISLSLAYTQALNAAYGEIASIEYLKQNVEVMSRLFDDGGDDEEELGNNVSDLEAKVKSMSNKVMALSEAKLDQALEKMGLNPSEYTTCSTEQKKIQFLNEINTRAQERASASVSGYLPVKTFAECNDKNECAVGVAVSLKVQTLNLIQAITSARDKYRPESGRKDLFSELKDKIKANHDFSKDLGVRMMYDDEGFPVFVSFAQAGVSKRGGDTMHSYMYESAQAKARQLANSYLSLLFNSSTAYKQAIEINGRTAITSKADRTVDCKATGYTAKENVNKIRQSVDKSIKIMSSSGISGIVPLHSWYKDFGQYETAGEIVTWSPKTALRSANLKNKVSPEGSSKSSETVKTPFSGESIDTDVYDF